MKSSLRIRPDGSIELHIEHQDPKVCEEKMAEALAILSLLGMEPRDPIIEGTNRPRVPEIGGVGTKVKS